MAEMIESIRKVTFDKNDTLVLTCEQHLLDEQYNRIIKVTKENLPEGTKVMLLEGGLSLSVLTQQEEDKCQDIDCPQYNATFDHNCMLDARVRALTCTEYIAYKRSH